MLIDIYLMKDLIFSCNWWERCGIWFTFPATARVHICLLVLFQIKAELSSQQAEATRGVR